MAKTVARLTGKVIRLIQDRGFGFIKGEDGAEYFFHTSSLANCDMKDLGQGSQVSFVQVENAKGPRADNVTLTR